MNNEQMIVCPKSKGDACMVTESAPGIKTYFSFSCGFQTNSLMKEGEKFYEEQISLLPDLYKDLIWKDSETELMWIPSMINEPSKGMIFANGPSAQDWNWAAVKAVPVTEEEKAKYPIPGQKGKHYDFRMDMTTMKLFPERDYMDALSYIGVLPE
jgi:hypothetical protein